MNSRCCSRTACKQPPVYTLTYVYRDSTAVLGPLAAYVEPHCYDLCEKHAARLVVPRGWDVMRLPPDPAQERVVRPDRQLVLAAVGKRARVVDELPLGVVSIDPQARADGRVAVDANATAIGIPNSRSPDATGRPAAASPPHQR